MNTWRQEVIELLKKLGGHAYLSDIYEEFEHSGTRPKIPNYKQTIIDTLEKGSEQSKKYDHKGAVFYMIDGKNKGHYGLVDYNDCNIEFSQDDDEFSEGKVALKKHLVRERNYQLIKKAKNIFLETHGSLYCEICGFNFKKTYGELGEEFIEAHHVKPVSQMNDDECTKISDIIMVCSNCHSMLHRKKPWASKEDIKLLLQNKKKKDFFEF